MRQVLLYDTTLRDGMQGQGMSLSAQEKVRVVRKLDELGIHFIEAGFPGSNPKELELFDVMVHRTKMRSLDAASPPASTAATGSTRATRPKLQATSGAVVSVATRLTMATLTGVLMFCLA